MTMELEHIYKHYAHQLPLRPSRTNTFLDVEGPLPEVASAANPASRIFVVPRSQIESSASAYNKMRILYIGQAVQNHIDSAAPAYNKLRILCIGQAVQVKEEGGLVELHSGCPGLSREHVKRAYQGAPSNNEIKRIEANVLPNGTLQITNNVLDKLPSDRKRRALREAIYFKNNESFWIQAIYFSAHESFWSQAIYFSANESFWSQAIYFSANESFWSQAIYFNANESFWSQAIYFSANESFWSQAIYFSADESFWSQAIYFNANQSFFSQAIYFNANESIWSQSLPLLTSHCSRKDKYF
eukprot:gene11660-34370_t